MTCTLCGTSSLHSHAVIAGSNKCIRCGAIVLVDGPIIVPGVNSTSYVLTPDTLPHVVEYISENGSYILSNGIIVLAEEDVQDYLNGNLLIDSISMNKTNETN